MVAWIRRSTVSHARPYIVYEAAPAQSQVYCRRGVDVMKVSLPLVVLFAVCFTCPGRGYSQEYRETLGAPPDEVWSALLHTLWQEEIALARWDEDAYRLVTRRVYLPDIKKRAVTDRRVSYMSGWDRSLAIWENVRYSLDISLIPSGPSRTELVILPKVEVLEHNTTSVYHRFTSSGAIESDFSDKLRAALQQLQHGVGIQTLSPSDFSRRDLDLSGPQGEPSAVREGTIPASPEVTLMLLERIMQGAGFTTRVADPASGTIISEPAAFSMEQEGLIFTTYLLSPLGLWDRAGSNWTDNVICTLVARVSDPSGGREESVVTVTSFFQRYEASDSEWHGIRSTGRLEKSLLETAVAAASALGSVDRYEFGLIHVDPVTSAVFEAAAADVWTAVLEYLDAGSWRIRKLGMGNRALWAATEDRVGNAERHALALRLEVLGDDRTSLDVAVSASAASPTETVIRYWGRPEVKSEVIRSVEENLMGRESSSLDISHYVDEQARTVLQPFIRNGTLQTLVERISLFGSVALMPSIEFLQTGIGIVRGEDRSSLVIPMFLRNGLDYEGGPDQGSLEMLARKAAMGVAFGLSPGLATLEGIEKVRVELIGRFFDIGAESPINRDFQKLTVDIPTSALSPIANLELDPQNVSEILTITLNSDPFDKGGVPE